MSDPHTNGHVQQAIRGFATPDGTAEFCSRFTDISASYHQFGETGLTCSSVGFGTYRVDTRVATHRAALAYAVRLGVNLIDSSANYADGNSERLVGEVLRTMIAEGTVTRKQLIIVTKGGYIQGENLKRVEQLVHEQSQGILHGTELAELVRYGPNLWHSIHPEFLKDQITRSLARLQIATIDVYLLHNPEYFLQWAIREGVAEDEARAEYERRIKQAFAYLETEVAAGRIKYYGISSNTFPRPEESLDRTSLERALQYAEELARDQHLAQHHFAAIQLPLNLIETSAVTELNQSRATKTVIEYAREHGVAVIVNRPLNAIIEGMLFRLADFPEREYPPEEDIDDIVHDLTLQEREFKNGLLKDISLNPQAYDAVKQLLTLGESLEKKWNGLHSFEEWKDLYTTVLAPRVHYVFDLLRPTAQENKALFNFLSEYAESSDELIEHISNYYSTSASKRSARIHDALDGLLPDKYEPLSLSQKAILIARSIPGVSSVLVGMRSDEYVEDVLYGLQVEELPDAEDLLKRLTLKSSE